MNKSFELKRLSAMIAVVALLLGPGFTFPVIAAPDMPVTITVDTTTDSNNASYQVCSTAANDCSLRGAISKANADASNTYTIVLPANMYALSLAGSGEDNNATGDLDILTNLTISGANSNTTIIDANKIDRVLDIIGLATSVWIKNIKITGGLAPNGIAGNPAGSQGSNGGGIQNSGILKLEYCIIGDNQSGDGGAGLALAGFPGGNGGPGGDGGGIYSSNSLTLMETIVRNNRSGDGGAGGKGGTLGGAGLPGGNGGNGGSGAGIDNSGSLTLIRSVISLNTTGNAGKGGKGGTATANGAPAGPGGAGGNGGIGGGISNTATLSMNDSEINGNLTGNGGAGGNAGSSTALMSGPPMPAGNGGSGGMGGGIFNSGATVNIDNSTISNNSTGYGGAGGKGGNGLGLPFPGPALPGGPGGNGGYGGGCYNSGTLNLTNLTVSSNTTGSGGAGGAGGNEIAPNPGGPGGIGGNGGDGGGFYNTGTTTTNNATIVSNSTSSSGGAGGPSGSPGLGPIGPAGVGGNGGGIFISAIGTFTVMNTILGNNTATTGPDCNGNLTSQDYNLVEDVTNCTIAGSVAGNITGQDPKIGPLANNGGSTQTHALKPGSPAIDNANPAAPGSGGFACMTQDQRGFPRPIDGDLDGTSTCDIGAYERKGLLYLPVLLK